MKADALDLKSKMWNQHRHTHKAKQTWDWTAHPNIEQTQGITHFPDCSLRQSASGMKFARNGSRTWFLRCCYWRSQAYFGQKPEEHCFLIEKRCLEVKNDDFWEEWITSKKCISFELFPLFKGPGRAHMGPYGPIILARRWHKTHAKRRIASKTHQVRLVQKDATQKVIKKDANKLDQRRKF